MKGFLITVVAVVVGVFLAGFVQKQLNKASATA
jgi:hypothetical protein